MSEVLASINSDIPREDLADYSKFEIIKYKNGPQHLYGVLRDDDGKERRVHLKNNIDEAYGHDPRTYRERLKDPEAWEEERLAYLEGRYSNPAPEVVPVEVLPEEELVEVEPVEREELAVVRGEVPSAVTATNKQPQPEREVHLVGDAESPREVQNALNENSTGWKDRLGSWREKAGDWLGGRRTYTGFVNRNVDGEIVREEVTVEREGDSRRTVAGIALGVLAVGVAFWLGTKYGVNGGDAVGDSIRNIEVDMNEIKVDVNNLEVDHEGFRSQLNDPNTGLDAISHEHTTQLENQGEILENQEEIQAEHAEILENQEELLDNDKKILENQREILTGRDYGGPGPEAIGKANIQELNHYGDTIWDHVEDTLRKRLGREPSDAEVRIATDKVLDINGLRWNGGGWGVDAHKLPVGFDFKMPRRLL